MRVAIGGGGRKAFDLKGGIPKEALGGWNIAGARGCKGGRLELLLCCLKLGSTAKSRAGNKALTHGAFITTSTSSSSEDITILLCAVDGLKGAFSDISELVELLEAIDYSVL